MTHHKAPPRLGKCSANYYAKKFKNVYWKIDTNIIVSINKMVRQRRQPNSTLQDRSSGPPPGTGQDDMTPDPLPPDVKIIEASCALAETRTPDNSKWVNIIKEPIEVAKGSEIRILSSFIDMRGIDQEIIQFQATGKQQDNAHTLLTQHYTTNDGYNNKTTSYDYMCYGGGLDEMDPGEGYNPGGNWAPALDGGSGTGANLWTFAVAPHVIRPGDIEITNPGRDYENGAPITIASGGDDFIGKIMTNDTGGIIKIFLTKNHSANNPPNPNTLVFTQPTLGTGATVNITVKTNGCAPSNLGGARTDAGRGTGYKYGDILSVPTANNGGVIQPGNQAKFMVNSVFIGQGQLNNQQHFDQGYNYERTPVMRWAQTFDINQAFAYGGSTGDRIFQSNGQEIIIGDENSHQVNDPCLSAGGIVMNKEDEFCPGVYHQKNNTDTFTINKPILYFQKTDQSSGVFRLTASTTEDGWLFDMESGNENIEINGKTVAGNLVNVFPVGSVWRFEFSVPALPTMSSQQLIDFSEQITRFWAMPFRVKKRLTIEENPNGPQPALLLNSSLMDYVGNADEFIFGTQVSPNGTYPPNDFIPVNTIYESCEEPGGIAPTENPVVLIGTDANGQYDGTYNVQSGGQGCRPGMIFRLDDTQYPGAIEKIYIQQVDDTGSWMFGADRNRSLTNDGLTFTSGGVDYDVSMFCVPVQHHSDFITEANSPSDTITENKGNRIGFRPYKNPATIGADFPATQSSGLLVKNSSVPPNNPGMTAYGSNGLFRSAGEPDSDSPFFTERNGALVNHDTDIQLQITEDNINLLTFDVSYGQAGTDVFVPYGTITDPTSIFYKSNVATDNWQIKLNKANWNALTVYNGGAPPLPLNTYVVIRTNDGTAEKEIHMETHGLADDDGTNYIIALATPDVEFTNRSFRIMSNTSRVALGYADDKMPAGIINQNTNNLNGNNTTSVKLQYTPDAKRNNTQISCVWNNMKGGIAFTGIQNFYNDTDINKSIMINEPLYKNNTISSRNTYAEGGYYFLTHFTGGLTTNQGTEVNYDLTAQDNDVFNRGLDYWNFSALPSIHYTWRSDYQAPNDLNYNQSFTNITRLWDYYKLLRQKTFIIDKNFCVASDISGIWTRTAHKLAGAVDMISGGEYVDSSESGILQNEFLMPVYGSNNRILPNGQYERLYDVYKDSNGLEPGHSVGINYLTSTSLWLAGDLMWNCPEDEDNNKFYYVFFRTPWTKIRGYDPLKSDGAGNPDRTALETVNQDAYKIGNANAQGQTSKKALDGSTMLATLNTNPPANPPVADNKGYELGNAGGVAPGGAPVRFGERGFYPIYYLDRGLAGQYPKAKISQYVGSQNLTLAFATDISTFTFQFLHNPYTSPFVDGQGGTQSVRIFFGNRKAGIFNHETLGGVVVVNYARPNYPHNTFTLTEITNNPTFDTFFQYGIDPFRSVGFVGRQFLNKLGFTDNDIGVQGGQILVGNDQLNYELTPYLRDITALTDGDVGANNYTIQSYDTKFYGTTGTDLDSSDGILSEIPAPESNAGLESFNQRETPEVGKSNPILRKFGDFIYYPYSLNADTNSFQDTAVVRFDNASSTYGAIGGLLLSNSNRGMGLPNTVGSTFICDQGTIPRTLNPDCELYLAYTVACGSSLKQASLLPVKLTNAYLLILSSLMKVANVYMPSAGFVNAMSLVNLTFLQGDFILSQGQMSFYAKESFVLSEITTEIKDTQFGAPSTLGTNSSIIYQITDYQPQPKRQLPTIEQIQDQDYEIMRIMNSHVNYLQGQVANSPLNQLNQDLYSIGMNLITTDKKSVDIISAIRNQINTHDLQSLTPAQRTQFLRTDEGQILLQNVGDMAIINQQLGNVAEAQNDLDGDYGGELAEQRLEAVSRTAQREVKAREQAIKERTPIIYFQPSEPLGEQIPPVRGLEDVMIKEIQPEAFRSAIPVRFANYLDYRENSMRNLNVPKSFLEYQQFQYGDVIQPNRPVRDIDPDFFADLRKIEGPDGEANYQRAVEQLNPDFVREGKNLYLEAYLRKPEYARGSPGEPRFDEEVRAFQDEIDRGVADLSQYQRDILGDLARPVHESVGSQRRLLIDRYRANVPKSKALRDVGAVFRTPDSLEEAEARLKSFDNRIRLVSPGKGRKSKAQKDVIAKINREKQEYIRTLEKGLHTRGQIVGKEELYRTDIRSPMLAGLERSIKRDDIRRAQNQDEKERRDEGIEQTRTGRAGRPPEADRQAREQMYRQLSRARERQFYQQAQASKLREPQSLQSLARSVASMREAMPPEEPDSD